MKKSLKKLFAMGSLVFLGSVLCTAQTAVEYFNKALGEFNYGNADAAMENINKAIALKADYADALSYRGYFYNQKKEYDKAISDYVAADKLKKNLNGYLIANPFALKGNNAEAFKWLEASLSATEDKPNIESIKNDAELNGLHADPKWNELINKNWYTPYETLINKANEAARGKDLKGALEFINKAVELEPKNHRAYSIRATNFFQQGQNSKAILDLSMAILLKPDKASYYSDRGYIYNSMEKYTEALADYNKVIELDPAQSTTYADRAMVKFSINKKDPGVAADLKTHLAAYYKDDFNWYFLGSYYYSIDNMTDAINCISKAINISNKQYDYFKKRGEAYFLDKQNSKAISDYTEAINLKPEDGYAYYLRGTAKGEALDKDGACADWRKAQRLGYADTNGYIKSICR